MCNAFRRPPAADLVCVSDVAINHEISGNHMANGSVMLSPALRHSRGAAAKAKLRRPMAANVCSAAPPRDLPLVALLHASLPSARMWLKTPFVAAALPPTRGTLLFPHIAPRGH